jgi:hypothetical protein
MIRKFALGTVYAVTVSMAVRCAISQACAALTARRTVIARYDLPIIVGYREFGNSAEAFAGSHVNDCAAFAA